MYAKQKHNIDFFILQLQNQLKESTTPSKSGPPNSGRANLSY